MVSHRVETKAVWCCLPTNGKKFLLTTGFSPCLYKERRNTLCLDEGKPWRGSPGPSAAGGTGRVGDFFSHAASLYSEIKTLRRKFGFFEGFSMQSSYFRIRQWVSLKQEILLSVEEVLLSKWWGDSVHVRRCDWMLILNSDLCLDIHKIPESFGLERTLKPIKFQPLPQAGAAFRLLRSPSNLALDTSRDEECS